MPFRPHQLLAGGEFQEWDALLHAAASDTEKVAPIWFGKASVAFSDIRCDGECCPVQLVARKK